MNNFDVLNVETGNIIFFTWKNDENWSVEFVSPSVFKILGYKPEEFTSKQIKYSDLIHPDDIDHVTSELIEACNSDAKEFTHKVYRLRNKQGDFIFVQDHTVIIRDKDNNISNFQGYVYDITETFIQKERLKLVLEGTNLGLWDWNPQTDEVVFDERWAKMLGYELSEIEFDLNTWSSKVHPDDLQQCFTDIQRHINAESEFYSNIHRMKHKNGEWRYILDRGKIVERNVDGKPVRFTGTHTDITDLKQIENVLRASEEKLLGLFGMSPLGIALTDMNGRYIEFNDAFANICGYTKEELNNLDYWELTPEKYAKDEERQLKSLEQTGRYGPYEKEYRQKSGNLIPINLNGMLVTGADGNSYIWSLVEDITERKKANLEREQYLKLVDENVIVSSTDLYGNITYISQAFCVISGYTREELMGRSHNIVRHPDMGHELYRGLWDTITNDKTWEGEIKNKRKDGSFYWVKANISPKYDDQNNKVGYTAIRQDITDKKRVEELAITDRLTQIYNRIHLDLILQKSIQNSQRYGHKLSIILLDVDKFKSVNDIYGHHLGDIILKETASVLKQNIRAADTLGRWGGEEFLIILPETGLQESMLLAEKLRMAMEQFKFKTVGSKTASFGVSSYHEGDTEITIVDRADKALYLAKENGRNRVEHGKINRAE